MSVCQSERNRLLEDFKKHTPIEHEHSVRWIVPSAAQVLDLRRLILSDPRFPGILGVPICTFRGMAFEVLAQTGVRAPALISSACRRIILRDLLSQLDCFSTVRETPHMPDALGSTIRSLKIAAICPDTLRRAVECARLAGNSRRKLLDLAAFYESFQMELARLDLCETEDLIGLAVQALRDNPGAFKSKRLFVSDFHHLTPAQQEFIRLLGCSVDQDDGSDFSLQAENITLFTAPTLGGETEFAAREIRRLVRESGLGFSEIGIIARDCRPFLPEISAVFREYCIPLAPMYHPLANHPIAGRVLESLDDPKTALRILNDLCTEERSDYAAARAIRRILDEIASTERHIGRKFTASEFADLAKSAISSGSYHVGDEDGVSLVDAGSLGWREFKVGFIVGLVHGRFSRHPSEDPLLLDWERKALNPHLPNPLDLMADQEARERRFFQSAVGSVSERLYLSRSAGMPSVFLDGIRGHEIAYEALPPIDQAENEPTLVRSAISGCCKGDPQSAAICNMLVAAVKISPRDFEWLDEDEPSVPVRVADILGKPLEIR